MRALAITTLLGVVAAVTVSGGTGVAGTAAADPFTRLPSPAQLSNPAFVGHTETGASVALVLTGPDAAVAYVCDGTGGVGEWFSGPVDLSSGHVSLTSKSGGSLTYDIAARTGSFEADGTTSSFTLERATGAAGLFRQETKRNVIGWIVDNDGLLVGEATNSSGKTVGATSQNLTAPAPTTQSATVVTTAPVTTGLLKQIQCGILGARSNFNNQQGVDASAAGDTAGFNDAKGDNGVIVAKQERAGCAVKNQ
ncbi:MAG TPA: hypothetical protein VIH82_09055 [Acidimicrobiia bacterium]